MTRTETIPSPISERLVQVRARIAAAALRAGRSSEDVTLVAVSKTHPPRVVREAIAAGIADLGENKIQEAEEKIPEVGRDAVRWHLIGHLQSNKARKAIALFDIPSARRVNTSSSRDVSTTSPSADADTTG